MMKRKCAQLGNAAGSSSVYCVTINSEFCCTIMSTFIIHYTLHIYSISITCAPFQRFPAAVADLPYRIQASSLSGRIRKKKQCKPRHLSAIYNSLVLGSFMTPAKFIGDNKRKRWDASLSLLPMALFHLPFLQGWFTTGDPCGCLVENRQQSVWDENWWAVAG